MTHQSGYKTSWTSTFSATASWCIGIIVNELDLHMLPQGLILSVHIERRGRCFCCTCDPILTIVLGQEVMNRGDAGVMLLQDCWVTGGCFLNTQRTAHWSDEADFVAINISWLLLAPFPTKQKENISSNSDFLAMYYYSFLKAFEP